MREDYIDWVISCLRNNEIVNKRIVEKKALSLGIDDRNTIKELTELAIVIYARELAALPIEQYEKFTKIVDLYRRQVILSHRTSQSILLQQYSTPAPIGYLLGVYCKLSLLTYTGDFCFEPSAGNGLLTIAANPRNVIVNEIDNLRNTNLHAQGFYKVLQQDATIPFSQYAKYFSAVLTNPPFGSLVKPFMVEDYKITSLEHLMAIRALETMKDNGRAAIIIGGNTRWDDLGRVQPISDRIFFNYLYSRFQVDDVINIDGKKLYSRQGTAVNVRLILIDGRKDRPIGATPLFDSENDIVIGDFNELYDRIMKRVKQSQIRKRKENEQRARQLREMLNRDSLGTLEAPYQPASNACVVLDTQVPDSMSFETQSSIDRIRIEVGGDMDNFVRHRLGFNSKTELCNALAAEQIDAVGTAIYNIEAKNQGMIIGDQTGIGKGRIAAAIIRYAIQQNLKPIFLTEKSNLFSDIYRDLLAIGSAHLRPFIVNSKESKTDIKDQDGNVVYQALPVEQQKNIFQRRELPAGYDYVVATYSQFSSPDKKPDKPLFLAEVARNSIVILDESHNSSGSSNTGAFLQNVVAAAKGVVFLSATFAKRPDNMPIYALKTAIADCTMSKEELVDAISLGGVALQEILSAQLVAEGQMLRRERSFEGVEVNYITLTDQAQEHRAISDNITSILRDIIAFQDLYVNKVVKEMDKVAAAEGKETELRKGTSQAGVDNQPYFSKIFQVINQMLFSIKAASVAERAIMRLKEGKKPVIAFSSTMGSFLETLENETGAPVGDGDVINADFAEVLYRGLEGVLRYTEKDVNGKPIYKRFSLEELGPEAASVYYDITDRIKSVATGITISPIDVILKILKDGGYTVAEVTGRKYELQLNFKTGMGLVASRRKINTNDAFRQFNNNEVDVLMINQAGSTGASAHAIPTSKVPANLVKQRVMIVLQAELDINREVQKRGRINRTGQILKPIYDYVTSAIPAEMRLMMMLQKKLKSLDANTSSNQKQSTKILDVPDFLNKYGDVLVLEYLKENKEINRVLDNPLGLDENGDGGIEDAAHKVSGRVAVLDTLAQQDFYNEMSTRYNDYVEYLQQVGEYDLEVEAMNLQAETISSRVVKMGKGGDSAFGDDSILETVQANVLKKPFTAIELENLLVESLNGRASHEIVAELVTGYENYANAKLEQELEEENSRYDDLISLIPYEKSIRKLASSPEEQQNEINKRRNELLKAKEQKLSMISAKAAAAKSHLVRVFNFFYPGRLLNYPIETYSNGSEVVPAVFIGYLLDLRKKNPYLPSQIKLRFAIASSNKYVAIPLSFSKDINAIIGVSNDIRQKDRKDILTDWTNHIQQTNVDRRQRHIITGNLLQAFSEFKGKLVSYTTMNGAIRKGILMPEYWNASEQTKDKVTVPIMKALPLIRSLVRNSHIVTNNGLSFFKQEQQFKIVVGGSLVSGGAIYLDKDLLPLTIGNNFQKTSNKMVAEVAEDKISAFVKVLQDNHGLSVTVDSAQYRQIEKQSERISSKKPIELPPPEVLVENRSIKVVDMARRRRLENEAMALKLKLLLLAS